MKIFLYIWQLPQHVLGLIILKRNKHNINSSCGYKSSTVYWVKNALWGVSLGKYIFLPCGTPMTTVKHEYGHTIQSKIFGWLYLIVIGIPSASRNLVSRYMAKKGKKRCDIIRWYYKGYPEAWADKLGKVNPEERQCGV